MNDEQQPWYKHVWWAVRYGEWGIGYYKDKAKDISFIYYDHMWYDGYNTGVWIWKINIWVRY